MRTGVAARFGNPRIRRPFDADAALTKIRTNSTDWLALRDL
jgi:hypothetical protein